MEWELLLVADTDFDASHSIPIYLSCRLTSVVYPDYTVQASVANLGLTVCNSGATVDYDIDYLVLMRSDFATEGSIPTEVLLGACGELAVLGQQCRGSL